jgi:hypothetical protein
MRIASIKPEFWTDEKVVLLSRDARLLYVALWNLVDGYGLMEWSPVRVKLQVFPADNDIDFDRVMTLAEEVISMDMAVIYKVKGKEYLGVINYHKHQRVDTRLAKKYPPPDEAWWENYQNPQQNGGNGQRGITGESRGNAGLNGVKQELHQNEGVKQELHLGMGMGMGMGNMVKCASGSSVTAEELNVRRLRFDAFWAEWPKHVKKKQAEQIFMRRGLWGDGVFQKIMAAVAAQKRSEAHLKRPVRFIPAPTVWLGNDQWEDEIDEPSGPAGDGAGTYTPLAERGDEE